MANTVTDLIETLPSQQPVSLTVEQTTTKLKVNSVSWLVLHSIQVSETAVQLQSIEQQRGRDVSECAVHADTTNEGQNYVIHNYKMCLCVST